MREPKISRQGKKLHISYEHPHRINTSKLYPVPSPNGSTIVISATQNGLHLAWHGGKPLYFTSKSEGPVVNGTKHGNATNLEVSQDPESDDEALFESDDEEIDDDQPYPSMIQDLEIPLNSPALHLAVPEIPLTSTSRSSVDIPTILTRSIMIAVACADGSTKLVTIPSSPPSAASKRKRRLGAQICSLGNESDHSIIRGISMTWTPSIGASTDDTQLNGRHTRSRSRSQGKPAATQSDTDILVAIATSDLAGQLAFFRVPILHDGKESAISTKRVESFQTTDLSAYATQISFNISASPSPRHSQLLVADVQGCLRIYDPLAPKGSSQRPSSRDSQISEGTELGAWLMTFTASFQMPNDSSSAIPGLARRKKILNARWVCGGRSILALVEDGEWGVWDVDGAGPKASNKSTNLPVDFAIRGFLGDSLESSSTLGMKPKSRSQLAPMTPNTRRVRQENLFSGPANHSGTVTRGGISAISTMTDHGSPDNSIVMWYGENIYIIPDLMGLWQRSVASSGRDTGSLYGPGLSRVEGLDLSGEVINSVNQLPPRQATASSGLGNITQRDLLVTAGHRFVFLANARPQVHTKSLFAREQGSPTSRHDQRLLDQGDLDIGGVDRLIDGMAGIEKTGTFGKGKRVGFAAH